MKKIKVPFTKLQHETVNDFLQFMREGGMVEKDLGTPVTVVVDWGHENDEKKPHVLFKGPYGQKVIPIKDIIEADDSKLPAPVLRAIPGGKT